MQLQIRNGEKYIRAALLAIYLYFSTVCLALAEDKDIFGTHSEPKILKACVTAYLDFKNHFETKGGETEFETFMSNIDNYQITAYLEEQVFVVQFSPKPFHGTIVRGGLTRYRIDATGEKIIELRKYR
jgi:hypothetical protein